MDDPLRLLLTNAGAAGLIALLAWAAARTVRRQAVVHGLWLLALVKLVTPPIAPLPLVPAWPGFLLATAPPAPTVVAMPPAAEPWASDGRRAIALVTREPVRVARRHAPVAVTPAPVARPARSLSRPWPGWRAAAWLSLVAGALAISLLTAWRLARFGRLLVCARPAPAAIAERAAGLAGRLGLRRAPPVLLVPARIPPMLWPHRGGPRLLLPARLLPDLDGEELDALLAHELAHVHRRDHWVRLVEIAATALFWWYPVTWWARRALRRAEERCCDEWVLRLLPRSAEAYANGLLKSLTFVAETPVPAAASGLGPVDDIEARLKEILMTRPAPQLAAPLRLALAVAAAFGLAVFPTHAQSGAAKDDTPAPAAAAKPADAKPAVAKPAAAATPAARPGRRPAAAASPGGAVGGVPGGVVGGVPGGVVGGVQGGVVGGVAGDDGRATAEERALEDQRRAIEAQKRKLHEQEMELERQSLELEARSEQVQFRAAAARLRADGKPEDAARVEKQAQISAQRVELQKRQLQLETEHSRLEAEVEAAARASEERADALEAAGKEGEAEALRAQMERSNADHERASQELEKEQHALEAEMEQADKQIEALEAEQRVQELRNSTEDLVSSLAEQIASLKEALPDAAAQKGDVEREILRLQAALDALQAGGTPKASTRKTPRPQP
jgi:Zn-dependent protease with chaperone function